MPSVAQFIMKSSVINAISTYLFYISTLVGWNGETIIYHTDKYIQLVQICLNEHLVDNISIQSFGISRSVELIRKQNRETTNFSVLF